MLQNILIMFEKYEILKKVPIVVYHNSSFY